MKEKKHVARQINASRSVKYPDTFLRATCQIAGKGYEFYQLSYCHKNACVTLLSSDE